MTTLSKQYLESGTYEVTLEKSEEATLISYVNTRFGQFTIVPISSDIQVSTSLEKYSVYLDNGLIGEVFINPDLSGFEYAVAQSMSAALDIITNKIHELIDKEERSVLAKVVSEVIGSINITEEQKALYRTFLIENDKLDDVIEEMENPTDILGDSNG